MVIWFNCEKARNQLKFYGRVITCRVRRKQFGITNAVYRVGKRINVIGKVEVLKLRETKDNSLDYSSIWSHRKAFEIYLKDSGFETAKEWEEQVLNLNRKDKIPSYLIFLKVTLKDERVRTAGFDFLESDLKVKPLIMKV